MGANAETPAACGDCKPWLCGQTGDSHRQIRCFLTATHTLFPLLTAVRLPKAVTAARCVVWGCSSGLGLEHILCVCVEHVHLYICGFKRLDLDVARLHVNLQPGMFVQDFFPLAHQE